MVPLETRTRVSAVGDVQGCLDPGNLPAPITSAVVRGSLMPALARSMPRSPALRRPAADRQQLREVGNRASGASSGLPALRLLEVVLA